jgi:O-glycosyl hydrolase
MTRFREHRLLAAVVVILGALAGQELGCSPSSGPQLGSQTNWLILCDVADECGGLSCLCGACTQTCNTGACDDLPGSVCVPQSDPGVVALCGGDTAPNALCLPRCDDGVCEGGTVCVSGVCVPGGDVTDEVVIDLGTRFQSLVGFGAGIGFTEDLIAEHPQAEELYDVLFAESGLDALRVRNRYEGSNDADLLILAGIVEAAQSRMGRMPALFLSESSPPPALKANGSRGCGGNADTCTIVQTDAGLFDYAGFANHWRTSLDAYAAAGLTFDYLGIQNHPNFVPPAEAPGEACRFLPQEGTEAVTVDGVEVMASLPGYVEAHTAVESALAGLANAPILTAPDTTGVGTFSEYVEPMNAATVGALSIHLYGMDPDAVDTARLEAIRSLSEELGVPVLQTELRAPLRDTAIHLHHVLTSAGGAAYLQNDLVAKDDAEERFALVRLTDDAYELLPLYDVFAHYARYTDPGYVRVAADVAGDGVLASAWLAPDESALSIVLYNPTDAELHARVTMPPAVTDGLSQSTVVRSVFSGVERSAVLGALPEDGIVRLPPGAMATVAFQAE